MAAPAGATVAWSRGGLFVIGGLWGVLVTVFLWPLRQDGPLRDAIAATFDRIGAFVDAMPHDRRAGGAERAHVTEALIAARDATVQYRRGRAGQSATATMAVATLDALDTLELGLETLDDAAHDIHDAALTDALTDLAEYCRSCARAVRARQPMPVHQSITPAPREAHSADERTVREGLAIIHAGLAHLGRPSVAATMPPAVIDDAGPDRPRAIDRLPGLLHRDSIVFRHALRVALIVGLAEVVAGVDPFTNASWIPLTVLIVLKPDMGSTLERGIQRIVGTVIGAIAAFAAVDLVGSDEWLLVGCVAILTFAVAATMPRNYGLAVIGITPSIIVLFSIGGAPLGLIGVRVGSTLVGGGLALLGGWLLWPLWQKQQLPHLLATGARGAADFADAVAAPPPTSLATMSSTHRRAERARSNAESALQKMLSEPQAKWVAPDAVMSFCAQLRSVVGDLTALQADVHTAGDPTAGLPRPSGMRSTPQAQRCARSPTVSRAVRRRKPCPSWTARSAPHGRPPCGAT